MFIQPVSCLKFLKGSPMFLYVFDIEYEIFSFSLIIFRNLSKAAQM